VDFKADPGQLILGGGSGEHPAMVLSDPQAAVAYFLSQELCKLKSNDANPENFPLATQRDAWMPVLESFIRPPQELFVYFEWTEEQHEAFRNRCQNNPLHEYHINELGFHSWLVRSFGEFVFFAMPDLAPELASRLKNPNSCVRHSYYNNIMMLPPNFPVYSNGGNAWICRRRNLPSEVIQRSL
jgi:hypothetical protein